MNPSPKKRLLTTEELTNLLLSVGTHKKARLLSPMEVSDLFKKVIDNGGDINLCAKIVNFEGTSMVSRFLYLQGLNSDLKHLVDWGQSNSAIPFSSACEISKVDPDDQVVLAQKLMEINITKNELIQIIQVRKRSNKDISTCINEIIKLRNSVEIKHVIMGKLSNPAAAKIKTFEQRQRDAMLGKILCDFFSNLSEITYKLGLDKFTLIVNEGDYKRLSEIGIDLIESKINSDIIGG